MVQRVAKVSTGKQTKILSPFVQENFTFSFQIALSMKEKSINYCEYSRFVDNESKI